jgi:hypothetical protein
MHCPDVYIISFCAQISSVEMEKYFYSYLNLSHLFAPLDLDPKIHNEADQTIQKEAYVPQILGANRWDHLRDPNTVTHRSTTCRSSRPCQDPSPSASRSPISEERERERVRHPTQRFLLFCPTCVFVDGKVSVSSIAG